MTVLGLDLEVDRDHRRARVPRRVDHRLARRERRARCRRSSSGQSPPTCTDLDRHAVALLDVGGGAFDRVAEIEVGVHRRAAEQPRRAARAPATREADDGARIVGAALDHREGLQHGVVEVRGHLGALVGADALAALLHERVPQAPQPRPEDQREPAEDHGDRDRPWPNARERALRGEERGDARDDERAADRRRAHRPRSCRARPGSPVAGGRSRRMSSLISSSIGRRSRPTINAVPIAASTSGQTTCVANPSPIDSRQQQHPEHHRAERGDLHPVGARRHATCRRDGAAIGARRSPWRRFGEATASPRA